MHTSPGASFQVARLNHDADVFESGDSAAKDRAEVAKYFRQQQAGQGIGVGGAHPDLRYDGKLVGANGRDYPPNTPLDKVGVLPKDGLRNERTIIYTNGIKTTKDQQQESLQKIANLTGSRVVGVHNATAGGDLDVMQSTADKADLGGNKAVKTLEDVVYSELKAGRQVNLMGHSQGALITSRALGHVKERLEKEVGKEKAGAYMNKIHCETFGGAAAHYPDGPHYTHYVNTEDKVATVLGLGRGLTQPDSGVSIGLALGPAVGLYADHHPGKASDGTPAEVIRFKDNQGELGKNHSMDDLYLRHRRPDPKPEASPAK